MMEFHLESEGEEEFLKWESYSILNQLSFPFLQVEADLWQLNRPW